LKVEDVIISINGRTTKNTPWSKFIRELEIKPGDIVKIKTWRGRENYNDFEIEALERNQVYSE